MQSEVKRLRRTEAAEFLKANYGFGSAQTLAKWATTGGGPPFHKMGRMVLYDLDKLKSWAEKKMGVLHLSTSEYREPAKKKA